MDRLEDAKIAVSNPLAGSQDLEITYLDPQKLKPYKYNAKDHPEDQIEMIKNSIEEFGFKTPVVVDSNFEIIQGHGRTMASLDLGLRSIPCIIAEDLSEDQVRMLRLADNKVSESGWLVDVLDIELGDLEMSFDIADFGFELNDGILGNSAEADGNMTTEFGLPPFSILDTRRGEWQNRKREWKARIQDKGETREKTLYDTEGTKIGNEITALSGGVSILDPVLSEQIVYWFGCKGGKVLDPFAGDSVFGFVSSSLGMEFTGIELRAEQATLNQARVDREGLSAKYITDSSENMDDHIEDGSQDLIFSCPPYADLEKYSDDPKDLSNMSHKQFFEMYKKILQNTYAKLKDDRFAVIVMGEVRGKDGNYIGTVNKTIRLMEEIGYGFYNDIILINQVGTLRLTAGKTMRASRKVGKMHQNVLVFVKGSGKKAVEFLGDIETTEYNQEEDGEYESDNV